MSQSVTPIDAPAVSQDLNQFNYRPVPPLAPVSLFLGLTSIVSFITIVGLSIAALGLILSIVCIWQIRKAQGELGGKLLASSGLFCSTLFLFGGSGWHAYSYATEVPEGYRRINFTADISDKEFVTKDGRRALHPDVIPLVDQEIFVKGFMYNQRKINNLQAFVLLKDNGECCFGGEPKPFHMMVVKLPDGETINYQEGMLSVAGVLRANVDAGPGEPVYMLDATLCEPSRTQFQ